MEMKEGFKKLVEKLRADRDEIHLKIHLASMEAREEFEEAEKKWHLVKAKASDIADDAVETSEEYVAKSKIVGEELKETSKKLQKVFDKRRDEAPKQLAVPKTEEKIVISDRDDCNVWVLYGE